jgi:hypothetical protein
MKILLLLTFFLFAGGVFSQQDSVKRTPNRYDRIIRHELQVDPLSVWFNKGLSYGHRLKYTYVPNYRNQFSVETNGTWFNGLDFHASSEKWEGVFPRLNRTQLVYEITRSLRVCKIKGMTMSSRSLRVGYHYFQHAAGSIHSDYWILDSTVFEGQRTIAGFRSHSALVGLAVDFRSFIRTKKKTCHFTHRFSMDYLFSPMYQLHLYNSGEVNQPNARIVGNFLPINRSGAQFAYQLKHQLQRNFGLHVDVEALWAPFLKNYQPNIDYFVWRGSENIIPLFLNARAGIYWKF